MNISKILLTGTIACMALASCTNENDYLNDKETPKGAMMLEVSRLLPQPKAAAMETRAVVTDNFPVAVFRATDNVKVQDYAQASQVPHKVLMPVGKYYATAHTPGVMDKIMDTPYYSGRGDFEILTAVSTEAKVICRMANGSISVKYSADFAKVFSDWTVTLDDGSKTAIIYDKAAGLNPAIKYLDFEPNTKQLNLNFRATLADGGSVNSSSILTKKNAAGQYLGDTEFFAGGDAIVINLKPAVSTEGKLPGIDITANITFEESEQIFDIEVEDVIPETGGGNPGGGGDNPGGGGDNPGGQGSSAVTLELPKDMEVTDTTEPALGDTRMASANGLKSILVKIVTSNKELEVLLAGFKDSYQLDFINAGVEVVENQNLVQFFAELGQTLSVPNKGDKDYIFPLGKFFPMIGIVEGTHTIKVEVTDMQNNVKSGQVALTVKPIV